MTTAWLQVKRRAIPYRPTHATSWQPPAPPPACSKAPSHGAIHASPPQRGPAGRQRRVSRRVSRNFGETTRLKAMLSFPPSFERAPRSRARSMQAGMTQIVRLRPSVSTGTADHRTKQAPKSAYLHSPSNRHPLAWVRGQSSWPFAAHHAGHLLTNLHSPKSARLHHQPL
jgi:hypothetical protein